MFTKKINRDFDSRCRLSETDVDTIIQIKTENPRTPVKDLAERYGVSSSLISRLLTRHLDGYGKGGLR